MNEEKIKAFVDRILKECEQEGFTVEEASWLPQLLRVSVNDHMEEIRRTTKFRTSQATQ